MQLDITASIVVYRNDRRILKEAIDSVLSTPLSIKLFVVDNSPTDELRNITDDPRCVYIFNNANLGFGKAHNIAMTQALTLSRYHVVINPDVYFSGDTFGKIVDYMDKNPDTGQLMPQVRYPDDNIQYLCKLLPTPMDLIGRRFLGFLPSVKKRDFTYSLKCTGYSQIMNIPYLSGCFMFLRTSVLKEIGLFDERIFMYVEDADLTRRIHKKYKSIYYPEVAIYHHYAKGSYKSFKLMLYNMHGAYIYFNKYGWFFDGERRQINDVVLSNYCKAQ